MTEEIIWKIIPDTNEEYQVSNNGLVRRLVFRNGKTTKVLDAPRMIKSAETGNGYLSYNICLKGKRKTCSAHRLVLTAFVGNPPDGYECAHLNGNKKDNRIENLKWVTRKENHSHKKLHGTHQAGEKNSFSRFKEVDVLEMRRLRSCGNTYSHIGKIFNADQAVIALICQRKSWKHI